jgi:demethylmenaquinone methyltransferase/2-methoxy-6-polyprenyl-1,4-benzoquinol methylase
MATVFMKWLETSPTDYDRGIALLTLGRIRQVHDRIVSMIQPGDRVLEVGCGTGALTLRCARHGAQVTAIDISPRMLAVARRRASADGLADQIQWHLMDAASATDFFSPKSFDKIIFSLILSELDQDEFQYIRTGCRRLLAGGGKLIIADEIVPHALPAKLLFWLVRIPLMILTWLLTRTTTRVLRDCIGMLQESGFDAQVEATYLGGSLAVFVAQQAIRPEEATLPEIPQLRHRVTPWTLLKDLWCLVMRNVPPYPSVKPGLYAVGQPDANAPVLVTGNYDLTVRCLLRDIQGVDAYLLVVNSAGINVWCASGGGYLTGDKVMAAMRTSRLEQVVSHRRLILPQLCANGVDGNRITSETGWQVRWGPVYSKDIPAYLAAGQQKDDGIRWVHFPLKTRLEMAVVMWGFWGPILGLVLLLLHRHIFWIGLGGALFYYLLAGAVFPWLPGRDGFGKGLFLAALSMVLVLVAGPWLGGWDMLRALNTALGLGALALFAGTDYQGGTPHMRAGEIVHFAKVVPLELGLLLLYLFLPRLLRL